MVDGCDILLDLVARCQNILVKQYNCFHFTLSDADLGSVRVSRLLISGEATTNKDRAPQLVRDARAGQPTNSANSRMNNALYISLFQDEG